MRTARIVSAAVVLVAMVLVGIFGLLTTGDAPQSVPHSGPNPPSTRDRPADVTPLHTHPIPGPRSAGADIVGEGIPEPRITGIVIDLAGAPICGATITAIEEAALPGDPFAEDLSTFAETDASGHFSVECAAVGSHRVVIFALGYAKEHFLDCRAGDDLEVRLVVGASISGRICYPDDGTSVAGIAVRVGEMRTQTNDAGLFQLEGLAPGTVFISTESSWNGWAGAFEQIDLLPGDALWVDLELREGVTVVGRVVDRRDYSPIAGAEVVRGGRVLAVTDERGHYQIDGYGKIIELSDPLSARGAGYSEEAGHPIERGDSIYLLNFALGPTLSISGRVSDGTAPVERAIVRVRARRLGDRPVEYADGTTVAPPVEVVTEPDGSFSFPTVLAGAHRYDVSVKRAGYGEFTKEYTIHGTDPFDLGTLRLFPESFIEGVILDTLGNPLGDVSVSLRRTVPISLDRDDRTTHSDALGRFGFAGVGRGTFALSGFRDDLVLERRLVKIVEAGTVTEVEWLATSALQIEGVVQDRWHRPVAGIEVECASEDRFPLVRTTRTSEDGSFFFTRIPDGSYQLRARLEGGEAGCIRRGVFPEDGCAVLVIEPMLRVSGRVIDGDGFPYPGAFVVLLPPAGGLGIELRTTVDSAGEFSFPVEAGTGDLMIVAWPSEELWHETVIEGSSNPFDRTIDPRGVVRYCGPGDVLDPIVISGRE